ncbi:MAG: aldo/keto reductase [Planctomycetaceae bacterium]|jgi:aryl-alcohol dehydrogenase-like predicted oxidoreductase
MSIVEFRPLGSTGLQVSPIAMGCWPIAGITSLGVTEAESLATLEAAVTAGVNFFDTAYCYGFEGESERLIQRALGHRRDQLVLATKGGIHWEDRRQVRDGRPATLRVQCETSLRRLGTDHVDLLYLHAPDPQVPLSESAGALRELREEGKTRGVGLSNATVSQLQEFHRVCPLDACQPHFNMLQREIEGDILPWCRQHAVSVVVYWPLLKGLLAGQLSRSHVFPEGDGRKKYPMFQGDEWQRNQDLVDDLRVIAQEAGHTVAELVLSWTISQPGICAALCGARRPGQMEENARGMGWSLNSGQRDAIEVALRRRGTPVSRGAVT